MPLPAIISVSRRTDIPAFFPDWFESRLSRGVAEYRNPYSGIPASVSLERSRVAAFVFWTRNPRPFFPVLRRVERAGYPSLFHVTATGLGPTLEPSAPDPEAAVATIRALSDFIGPHRVLWRFDPILPGEEPGRLVERFEALSAALAGHVSRCIVSIARPYRKSVRATRGLPGIWGEADRLCGAARAIAVTGRARGIDVRSCCSPLLAGWGIPPAPCVDGEYLNSLYPGAGIPAESAPSRAGCLCAASRDIGSYRTCRHGCLYCYAA